MNENANLATDYFNNFFVRRLVTDTQADMELNHMRVPARHMGISRSEMPQIAGKDLEEFETYLLSKGIALRKKLAYTKDLTLTQMEYNKLKVVKIMRQISAGKTMDPILVSKDGYVLDGSHRFIAVHNSRDNARIPTFRATANIRDLLGAAREFPKASFRSYSDNKVPVRESTALEEKGNDLRTKATAWVILYTADKIILGKRSPSSNNPNQWNMFGGHIDKGETPSVAAARELFEETGYKINPSKLKYISTIGDASYFSAKIADPENVKTTGEISKVKEYKLIDLPDNLHSKTALFFDQLDSLLN